MSILDQLSGSSERWNASQRDTHPDDADMDAATTGIVPDGVQSPAEPDAPAEPSEPVEAVEAVESDAQDDFDRVPEPIGSDDMPATFPEPEADDDTDVTEVLPPASDPRPDEAAAQPRHPSGILSQLASDRQARPTPTAESAVLHLEQRLDESFEEPDRPSDSKTARAPLSPRRILTLAAIVAAVAALAGACAAVPHIIGMREARICDTSRTAAVSAVGTLKKNITAAKTYKATSADDAKTRSAIGKLSALASRTVPHVRNCPTDDIEALKSASAANLETVDDATSTSKDMASLVKRIDRLRDDKTLSDARLALTDRIDTAGKLLSSSEGKTDGDDARKNLRTVLESARKTKDSKDTAKIKQASKDLQSAIDKVNSSITARKNREDNERKAREEEERKRQESASQQEQQTTPQQTQTQQSQTTTPQYQAPRQSYTTPRRQQTPSTPTTPSTPAQPTQPTPATPADPGTNGVIM